MAAKDSGRTQRRELPVWPIEVHSPGTRHRLVWEQVLKESLNCLRALYLNRGSRLLLPTIKYVIMLIISM